MKHIARLKPLQPYDFDGLRAMFSRFAAPVFFHVDGDALWRPVRLPGGHALIHMRAEHDDICISLPASEGSPDPEQAIRAARWMLGVDAERAEFIALVQNDPTLRAVIGPVAAIPIWRNADLFEALIMTIIEQHISWASALRAQRWLTEWGGNTLSHNNHTCHLWPSAEQLAGASPEDLAGLKLTNARTALIIELAQRVISGEIDPEALSQQSPTAIYKALMSFKGIGHWTAANTIHRALGVYPYVLHNDVALQRAANVYFYGVDARLNATDLDALFNQWGPHAGLIAHYTMLRWVMDRYPVVLP